MARRKELVILALLVVVLGIVAYRNFRPTAAEESDVPVSLTVHLLEVQNPSLHLERLDQIRKLEYAGSHRNIFVAAPLPPPPSQVKKEELKPMGPPPPPPLQVPLTFFGMVTDPATGERKAFFNKGDDVYIATVGQVLLNQFRVVQIGNNTVELEEISTERRATLTMVPPVANQ
jgi:hypothetical protein